MRHEYRLSLGAALFLGLVALIYWIWSREDTGTALLIFSLAAYALIAGWLYLQWRRREGIDRPEDRADATQADGAGEVGFFPAASMWPAGMGLGAVVLGMALVFGSWYYAIGGALLLGSIFGFVVEAEAREEGPDVPGTFEAHQPAAVVATPGPGTIPPFAGDAVDR